MLNSSLHEELLVTACNVPRNIARLLTRIKNAMDSIDAAPAVINVDNEGWNKIAAHVEKHGEWRGYLSAVTYMPNPRTHKLIVAEFAVNRMNAMVIGIPLVVPVTYKPGVSAEQLIFSVMRSIGAEHEAAAEFIRSTNVKNLHIS